ncbi:hypothetical protein, partial [Shinella zoogloeoides]
MPPQQAYGLLDFVDDILDFRAHVRFFDASGFGGPEIERAGAGWKSAPRPPPAVEREDNNRTAHP